MGRGGKKQPSSQSEGPKAADVTSQENATPQAPEAVATVETCGQWPVVVQERKGRGQLLASLRALAPGEVVFSETPVLAMTQNGAASTLVYLQGWVDRFGFLSADQRASVLNLHHSEKAASEGPLASLMGKHGEKVAEVMRVPNGVTSEDVWALLCIIESNAIELRNRDGLSRCVLLLKVCRMNHSCLPNVLIGPGKGDGDVEVRVLRPILAGEELTVSYIDDEALLSPTPERRARLYGRWQFQCACDRCVGPDGLRAFRCHKQTCKGLVHTLAASDTMTTCKACGKSMSANITADALAAEKKVISMAPDAIRELHKSAGSLSVALHKRDAEAFDSGSAIAMHSLGQCSTLATSNKQVDPSHHSMMPMAKAAATCRTLLGDSLAATGRSELAMKMWGPAAGELKEAMDSEHKGLPLPRYSRIVDLLGLAGLHSRLGKSEAARACLQEALSTISLISWACGPDRRAELEAMQKGVETALADEN